MADRWGEKVIDVPGGGKSWRRTWAQDSRTVMGTDYGATYHVERVFAFGPDIPVVHKQLGTVSTTASQAATDPELGPHAAAIQYHTTALVEILTRRALASGALVDPDDPEAIL